MPEQDLPPELAMMALAHKALVRELLLQAYANGAKDALLSVCDGLKEIGLPSLGEVVMNMTTIVDETTARVIKERQG